MENPFPEVELKDLEPVLRQRLGRAYTRYSFHYCDAGRWEKLRLFIRDYWSSDHIYVKSPELVRWQQFDPVRQRYNFVVAEHNQSGEIHSCLGFIYTSHFDPGISTRDIWVGLWCSRPDAAPGIGGELMRFLVRDLRPRSVGALGLSRNTVSLFPRLGYTVGLLNHHYLLNPDLQNYALVGNPDRAPESNNAGGAHHRKLRLLQAAEVKSLVIDGCDFQHLLPMKTPAFMYNRYTVHPFYRYALYAVMEGTRALGILATRTVSAHDAKAIRIVDFIGHDRAWAGLGPSLIRLLKSEQAEFVDLYSYGLDAACMAASGMLPHSKGDQVIIPLYFEPFELKNRALDFGFVIPPDAKYRIFKGDSDQDRPNRIP